MLNGKKRCFNRKSQGTVEILFVGNGRDRSLHYYYFVILISTDVPFNPGEDNVITALPGLSSD